MIIIRWGAPAGNSVIGTKAGFTAKSNFRSHGGLIAKKLNIDNKKLARRVSCGPLHTDNLLIVLLEGPGERYLP